MYDYTHRGKYGKTRIRNIRLGFAGLYFLGLLCLGGALYEKPQIISPLLAQEELGALPTPTPTSTLKPTRQDIEKEIEVVFSPSGTEAVYVAQRIAFCESSFRPMATNGKDHGIFAIRYIHGYSTKTLLDWRKNIRIAYSLYLKSGWGLWSASKGCWQK